MKGEKIMAKFALVSSDLESFMDLMDGRYFGTVRPSREAMLQAYEFINEVLKVEAIVDIYDIVIHEFTKSDINENIKEAQSLLSIDNYSMLHGFIDAVQKKGYEFIPSRNIENGFLIIAW